MEQLIVNEVLNELQNVAIRSDTQLFGVSIGNLLSGFFGSAAGGALIGVSLLSHRLGSQFKETGVLIAISVFVILVSLHGVLNFIPLGCLAGILLSVALHAFKWFSLPMMLSTLMPLTMRRKFTYFQRKIPRGDCLIILTVTILSPTTNVVTALGVGVALAFLFFTANSCKHLYIKSGIDHSTNTQYFELEGPVFYGTSTQFKNSIYPVKNIESTVVVLQNSVFHDYASLDLLRLIKSRFKKANKRLLITGLKSESSRMLFKANHLLQLGDSAMVDIQVPEYIHGIVSDDVSSHDLLESDPDQAVDFQENNDATASFY